MKKFNFFVRNVVSDSLRIAEKSLDKGISMPSNQYENRNEVKL